MTASKAKPLMIEYELKFLETKLKELKKYIASQPFDKLEDRLAISGIKHSKDGSTFETYKIVATKEIQRKDLSLALKDYAEIVRTVDEMRTKEDKKQVAVRGDAKLGTQAEEFLKNRN